MAPSAALTVELPDDFLEQEAERGRLAGRLASDRATV
jgi:hypothetical protein